MSRCCSVFGAESTPHMHMQNHLASDDKWCVPALVCLQTFVQSSDASVILATFTASTCKFSEVGRLLLWLGDIDGVKSHAESHVLVKALLAVACRSKTCWNIVEIMQDWFEETLDPDALTLCFKLACTNFRFVVDPMRTAWEKVLLARGFGVVQHSLSGADAVLDFLERVAAQKSSFLESADPAAVGAVILEIVLEALVRYTSVGSKPFVDAIINVCRPESRFDFVASWPSLFRKCMVDGGQWKELCKAPHDNLCSLLLSAIPLTTTKGQSHAVCSPKQYDDDVVGTWASVLLGTPWCVTVAWMQGCCKKYGSWLGEAVVLRAVHLRAVHLRASDPGGQEEDHVTACFEAVLASYLTRKAYGAVKVHIDDSGWSGMVCAAVAGTWDFCKSSTAYVSVALSLLGLSVYMLTTTFVDHPRAVDIVVEAVQSMPVYSGTILCARNGMVSLRGTTAMPGFYRVLKAWVARLMEDQKNLSVVRQFTLVNFFWLLHFLQHEGPSDDLSALRALHTLVIPWTVDDPSVARELHDVLEHAVSPRCGCGQRQVSADHVHLVLRILVDLHGCLYGCMRGRGACNRVLKRIIQLGDFVRDACVDPRDHVWNARLFYLLADEYYFGSNQFGSWIERLVPSISSPVALGFVSGSDELTSLVKEQLVSDRAAPGMMIYNRGKKMSNIVLEHLFWFDCFFCLDKKKTGKGIRAVLPVAYIVVECGRWQRQQRCDFKIIFFFLFFFFQKNGFMFPQSNRSDQWMRRHTAQRSISYCSGNGWCLHGSAYESLCRTVRQQKTFGMCLAGPTAHLATFSF